MSATLFESVKDAHIRELTRQRDTLLAQNEKLQAKLDRWPAHAAEHARQCVARERERLTSKIPLEAKP